HRSMPGETYLLILLYALANPAGPVPAPPAIAEQPAAAAEQGALQQQSGPVIGTVADRDTENPASAPARQQEEPDRWAAALDLGFASSSGNSDLTSLTTGVRLKHLQTRLFKLEWSVTFRYGESQGTVVARNLQSKLDFDVGPAARVSPFV